jgi:hypothetical protein
MHTPTAHTLDRLAEIRAEREALRAEIDRRILWTWSALVPSTAGRIVDLHPYGSLAQAQEAVIALYREKDPRSALTWTWTPGRGHVLQARAAAEDPWTDTEHRVAPSVRSLHGSCDAEGPTGAVPPTPSVALVGTDLRMVIEGLRAELAAWTRWHGEYAHEADTVCTSGCFGGRIQPACVDCIDQIGAIDRGRVDAPMDWRDDLALDFGDDTDGTAR